LWGQWHIGASYLSRNLCLRCFGIVRTMPASSSWILTLCFMNFMVSEDNFVLRRLCFTLWIGYYRGRKTTAIQLYLADLLWGGRTEHSVFHWGFKLWDVISMWRTDLEMELCVPMMFCIQKSVVQKIVNEPLRSWRATWPV
jgi:hypothetical protein